MPDSSEALPARPSSPARRPQSPTACRAGRPTAGPSSSTRRRPQHGAGVRDASTAAAPAAAPDPLDQLQKLAELKAAGVLTDAEFEAQKAKILAS